MTSELIHNLEEVLRSGQTETKEFVVNEVLYRSFERGHVAHKTPKDTEYQEKRVMPSRFVDNLWYYIRDPPSLPGYQIKCGSNYQDIGIEARSTSNATRKIGVDDQINVDVLYRCEAAIDSNGINTPAEVTVFESF